MKKWWVEEFFFWLEPVDWGDRKWSARDMLWLPIPVDTPAQAKYARGPALICAGVATVYWTMSAIFLFFPLNIIVLWALISALIWGLVTWGLLKMRPEAAIAGIAFSVIGLIGNIFMDWGWSYYLTIMMVWMFVSAIRGTFAYQHLARSGIDAATGPGQ
jgi:hypothetical protein